MTNTFRNINYKNVEKLKYVGTRVEFTRIHKELKETGKLKDGEYFGIPYSIILPKGWKNLWVAGRCNSSDVTVHGSIRTQPAASMMVQAAGIAAVQSIGKKMPAYDIDTEKLVMSSRKNGAYLPQQELSKEMTRL